MITFLGLQLFVCYNINIGNIDTMEEWKTKTLKRNLGQGTASKEKSLKPIQRIPQKELKSSVATGGLKIPMK